MIYQYNLTKFIFMIHLVAILIFANDIALSKRLTNNDMLEYIGVLAEKEYLDYDDSITKLKEFEYLSGTNIGYLYQLYLNFILWDKDRKNEKNIDNAKRLFQELGKKYGKYGSEPKTESEIKSRFFNWMTDRQLLIEFVYDLTPRIGDFYFEYKLPLWLVLKYPQIFEYDLPINRYDPYPIEVAADRQVKYLPEFSELHTILQRMTGGYRATTSYMQYPGPFNPYIYGDQESAVRRVSFWPDRVLKYNCNSRYEDFIRPLKIWASRGLWNSILYKEFDLSFRNFTEALKRYYHSNYNFSRYEDEVQRIASILVFNYMPDEHITAAYLMLEQADTNFHSKALRVALSREINITSLSFLRDINALQQQDIKAYWIKFSKILKESMPDDEQPLQYRIKVWNEFLSRAILSDFSPKTIEHIINLGADVSASNFSEMPLMNAANKSEVMKLLFRYGADIDATNPFGKTALFYAIQFGDYYDVKLLIEKGADVNKALYSLDKLIDLYQKDFKTEYFLLDKVADFAPLVYADIKLLIEKGAYISKAFYSLDKLIELYQKDDETEDFLLEEVADFTPLVYAMRYSDKNVQDLLLSHDAHMGSAPQERIDAWVDSQAN